MFHIPPSKWFTLPINGAFDLSFMENMSVMEEPVAFLYLEEVIHLAENECYCFVILVNVSHCNILL